MGYQQYEYRCRDCGFTTLNGTRGDSLGTCDCGGELKRVWAVSIHRPVMAHFNQSLQQEVTSNKDFAEKLKRKGAEYTERTGIETNYQPIDPAEVKRNMTGEGLDQTNKRLHAEGKRQLII